MRDKQFLFLMTWNWQQSDWRHFTWSREVLLRQQDQFLLGGGVVRLASHDDGRQERPWRGWELSNSAAPMQVVLGQCTLEVSL